MSTLGAALVVALAASPDGAFEVRVDPRVELVTAVFRAVVVRWRLAHEGVAAARGDTEAPRVVSVTTANGADDVAPGPAVLRIEFDRPMGPGMSVMTLGGVDFPETTGRPSWDAAGRVLTVPVRLTPDHAYGFGLNRPGGGNFVSREGVRLEAMRVEFRTRGG